MNRLAFLRRAGLAAAACAFLDVPWPKRELFHPIAYPYMPPAESHIVPYSVGHSITYVAYS